MKQLEKTLKARERTFEICGPQKAEIARFFWLSRETFGAELVLGPNLRLDRLPTLTRSVRSGKSSVVAVEEAAVEILSPALSGRRRNARKEEIQLLGVGSGRTAALDRSTNILFRAVDVTVGGSES